MTEVLTLIPSLLLWLLSSGVTEDGLIAYFSSIILNSVIFLLCYCVLLLLLPGD